MEVGQDRRPLKKRVAQPLALLEGKPEVKRRRSALSELPMNLSLKGLPDVTVEEEEEEEEEETDASFISGFQACLLQLQSHLVTLTSLDRSYMSVIVDNTKTIPIAAEEEKIYQFIKTEPEVEEKNSTSNSDGALNLQKQKKVEKEECRAGIVTGNKSSPRACVVVPPLPRESEVSRIEALIRQSRRAERLSRWRKACRPELENHWSSSREVKGHVGEGQGQGRDEYRYEIQLAQTDNPTMPLSLNKNSKDCDENEKPKEENVDKIINLSSKGNEAERLVTEPPPEGFVPDVIVCRHCVEEELKKAKTIAHSHNSPQKEDTQRPLVTDIGIITIEPRCEEATLWRPW